VADGSGTLSLSSTPVNMFPAGQSGDSPDEETAILTGSFTLATLEAVTFQVGADDDAFVYVDGSLVESLGGIHSDSLAAANTVDLNAGTHSIEIFYADQMQTGASLSFYDDGVPVSAPPPSITPSLHACCCLAPGWWIRRHGAPQDRDAHLETNKLGSAAAVVRVPVAPNSR